MSFSPLSDLSLSAWLDLAEQDLLHFQRRLQERTPRYRVGDRVWLFGDLYWVRAVRRDEPGYELELAGEGLGPQSLFLPLDCEPYLLLELPAGNSRES